MMAPVRDWQYHNMSSWGFTSSRISVIFATVLVATSGLIVAKSVSQSVRKSSVRQQELPVIEGNYGVGCVELQFPEPTSSEAFRVMLTNDACLATAVKKVREKLYVTVRGLEKASPAMARSYLAELYTQLWDVACMHEKMLLDVRVLTPIRNGCVGKDEIITLPELEVVMSTEIMDIDPINDARSKNKMDAIQFIHLQKEKDLWQGKGILFCEDKSADFPVFHQVACGGTFDNLHNGHKKLLSMAASATAPEGTLTVGVTSDEMLKKKKFGAYIEDVSRRIQLVEEYLQSVCPGIKTRVCQIDDPFGPPIHEAHFEAIIVSSETLAGGEKINEIRKEKGMLPLTLIITRRTEATSLSSTAIREYIHKMQQSMP
mmetsp:Transcript_22443/g.29364  ORF Transcript_22443/g.29364 Transcript_22443/m.29364 type:complete len:373 (+) Transcript_22443:34-1152(+)